jgi:hypothetical protein
MNTLTVVKAQTETSPGEFVTDGFSVQVNVADKQSVSEFAQSVAGQAVYTSHSPLKAAVKAIVLLADPRFSGFVISVEEDDTPTEVGKDNLVQRLKAERFDALAQVIALQPPVDEIVAGIKAVGNNIDGP